MEERKLLLIKCRDPIANVLVDTYKGDVSHVSGVPYKVVEIPSSQVVGWVLNETVAMREGLRRDETMTNGMMEELDKMVALLEALL
jgi:hypothetical protein